MAKKTVKNRWRDNLDSEIVYQKRYAIIKKLPNRWVFFGYYYQVLRFYPNLRYYTELMIPVKQYYRKELVSELDEEDFCILMMKDPRNVI